MQQFQQMQQMRSQHFPQGGQQQQMGGGMQMNNAMVGQMGGQMQPPSQQGQQMIGGQPPHPQQQGGGPTNLGMVNIKNSMNSMLGLGVSPMQQGQPQGVMGNASFNMSTNNNGQMNMGGATNVGGINNNPNAANQFFQNPAQQQQQAQAALYWNALQAQQGGTTSGTHQMQHGGGGGQGGQQQATMNATTLGMMNVMNPQQQQMQQLLSQQQQWGGGSSSGSKGGQQQQTSHQSHSSQGQQYTGGGTSQQHQYPSQQGGQYPNNQAQLLLQQQNLIAQLQRQIQSQTGAPGVPTPSNQQSGLGASSSQPQQQSNQQQLIMQSLLRCQGEMMQVMEAIQCASSSQSSSGNANQNTQQQQRLMAQIIQHQRNMGNASSSLVGGGSNASQAGGSGNQQTPRQQQAAGAAGAVHPQSQQASEGHGVMLEQRVKQFQVMQHLQQQKQGGNESSSQGGAVPGGSVGGVSQVGRQGKIPPNVIIPNNGGGGMAVRRDSEVSLAGVSPDPIAIGATISSTSFPPGVGPNGRNIEGGQVQIDGMHVDARISSGGQGGGNITENNEGANGGGLNRGQPQSFLDGHFAGGWQSNADLADRRRIIFSIIKVIERMRPDANRMSQNSRLPLMATKLEEHLYRSAHTKEEYIDPASLKRRLHLIIAKGVGVPKSGNEGDGRDSLSLCFGGGGSEDGTVSSNNPSAGQSALRPMITRSQPIQMNQQLLQQMNQLKGQDSSNQLQVQRQQSAQQGTALEQLRNLSQASSASNDLPPDDLSELAAL
eukprot:g5905.t1 g5905   contig20:403092-405730(+)